MTAQRKATVRLVLKELPGRERDLLQQVFLEEQDKDEVCQRLGVDRGYLRVLLHRARLRFGALLAQRAGAAGAGR